MKKYIILAILVLGVGAFFGVRYLRGSPEARMKRAEQYYSEGRFEEARVEYMNVLRKDPKNGQAMKQLAYTWLKQGAPFSALRFLRAAVELEPENPGLRQKLAETWLELRQLGAAREEAAQVLTTEPLNESAVLLLVQTSFGEEQLAEAEERLSALESSKPGALSHLARALLAQRKGDADAAKASLDQALAVGPKVPKVLLARAAWLGAKERLDEKREALKLAAENSESRSTVPLSYVSFLMGKEEKDEAAKVLEGLRAKAPDFFPYLIALARVRRSQEDWKEAELLLDKVLASDSLNLSAMEELAQVHLEQDNRAEAIKVLEQLNSRAGIPLNSYRLARLYVADGEIDKARRILAKTVGLNPNFAEAALLLAEIELRSGQMDEGIAILEGLLERQPEQLKAEVLLASAYQAQGRLDETAAIYRGQVERTPENAGSQFALGGILLRLNKPDEARKHLEEAHRLRPDELVLLTGLVELDALQGEFATAHSRVLARLEEKETWQLHALDGRIWAVERKWPEAREALNKALKLEPGSIPVFSLLAATFLAEQKPEEAITELEALLEANPGSTPHRMLIAILHGQQDKPKEAAKVYEEILKQNPDFVPALNNLAYHCAAELNQPERAEELARKALAQAPEQPNVLDTLGWTLHGRGKFPEALPLLEKAAEILPDDPEVLYHLGSTRARMGKVDTAREALRKAVESTREFADKEKAREELAALDDPNRAVAGLSIAQLEEELKKQPKDATKRLQLAKLREEAGAKGEGTFEEAAAEYEAALKLDKRLPSAWMGLARLYGGPLNDLPRAIESSREARRLDGADPDAAALLGHLILRRGAKGDVDWAAGMLWEASRELDSPQVLRDLGWARYLQGRLPEAREIMEKLVANHIDSEQAGEAAHFLVFTQPGASGWKSLAPAVEERLKADPGNLPALMAQGRIQPKRAIAIYEEILKSQPDFVDAKLRLAAHYAREKDRLKDAKALVREVQTTLRDDPELTVVRAILAYREGENEEAIEFLEQLQKTAPLDAEGLFYLGKASLDENRLEAGHEALREALKQGLDEELEAEAQSALGSGGS